MLRFQSAAMFQNPAASHRRASMTATVHLLLPRRIRLANVYPRRSLIRICHRELDPIWESEWLLNLFPYHGLDNVAGVNTKAAEQGPWMISTQEVMLTRSQKPDLFYLIPPPNPACVSPQPCFADCYTAFPTWPLRPSSVHSISPWWPLFVIPLSS